jgi:hypothetical protein
MSNCPASRKRKQELDFLYTELRTCGEIANSSKHFALKTSYRPPTTSSVASKRGYGVGRLGYGRYGVGEEHIDIILTDGATFSALRFKDDVVRVWDEFFAKHGI